MVAMEVGPDGATIYMYDVQCGGIGGYWAHADEEFNKFGYYCFDTLGLGSEAEHRG